MSKTFTTEFAVGDGIWPLFPNDRAVFQCEDCGHKIFHYCDDNAWFVGQKRYIRSISVKIEECGVVTHYSFEGEEKYGVASNMFTAAKEAETECARRNADE